MRLAAALLVLAFALAGCSDGGGDDAPTPAGTQSASGSSTGPPPKPVPTSDTLHFLEAPTMAPAIPAGYGEVSTPASTGGFGGGGGGGQEAPAAEWTYKVQAPTNLTGGEVHVWIQITDTLVQFPDPRPDGGCTWFLTLELGADSEVDVGCLTEPPGPINPGTKELIFPILSTDGYEMEANETILVRFDRAAFSASPENSVFVLSGSVDHDSRITLRGLKEPIQE